MTASKLDPKQYHQMSVDCNVNPTGLPFRTTDSEIEKLFSGLSINKLVIVKDPRGDLSQVFSVISNFVI